MAKIVRNFYICNRQKCKPCRNKDCNHAADPAFRRFPENKNPEWQEFHSGNVMLRFEKLPKCMKEGSLR